MKRKIIKLGTSTLVVSLPSKWARKFNITTGNEIDMEENNIGELILQAKSTIKKKKEIEISFEKEDEKDIYILLISLYRRGYEKITITNITKKKIEEITKITYSMLLGFEIIDKSESSCVLDNIAEPSQQKYSLLVRRIFLTIKETINKIYMDFDKKKYDLTALHELKDQNDKFINFCKRTILYGNKENSISEWELLSFLLQIEHALFYFYKYMSENKIVPQLDMIKSIEDYSNYFNLLYEGYFTYDLRKLQKITSLRNKYHYGDIIKKIEKKSGKEAVAYSFLKELFRITQISISPIISMITEDKYESNTNNNNNNNNNNN
jgi:phosphate uptake regulator